MNQKQKTQSSEQNFQTYEQYEKKYNQKQRRELTYKYNLQKDINKGEFEGYVQQSKNRRISKQSNQQLFYFDNPILKNNNEKDKQSKSQIKSKLIIDSCFPCGNIQKPEVIFQYQNQNQKITINIQGNPDVQNDSSAKYWFYFRIRGFQFIKEQSIQLTVNLKKANCYRKFIKQKKYRPYIVYKIQGKDWQPIFIEIKQTCEITANFDVILRKQEIEKKSIYFALNYPYSLQQLQSYLSEIQKRHNYVKDSQNIYFNVQTLCYSCEFRRVQLITITSKSNINKFQNAQNQEKYCQEMFPDPNQRHYKLAKNKPCLFFSARVHPSQVASSYFIEGLIDQLMNEEDIRSKILRQMFIIYIVPILNPDGVQCGNYRLDNKLNNLNRFYGHSSFQNTPSIKAVQILLEKLSTKNNDNPQIMMYFDIHGHNSPKHSFIFGNYTKNVLHMVQNKYFCKLFQKNNKYFSANGSEFSQKNMNVKQKYDEHSKLYSGRVFAGQSIQNLNKEKQIQSIYIQSIHHSYTIEILPYKNNIPNSNYINTQNQDKDRLSSSLKKQISNSKGKVPISCSVNVSSSKQQLNSLKYQQISNNNNINDMRVVYKDFGKDLLITILDLFQMNPSSDLEQTFGLFQRKILYKQIINGFNASQIKKLTNASIQQFSNNRSMRKQIYDKIMNQYFERWFNDKSMIQNLDKELFQIEEEQQKVQNKKNSLYQNPNIKLSNINQVNFIQNIRKFHHIKDPYIQQNKVKEDGLKKKKDYIKILPKVTRLQNLKNQGSSENIKQQDIYIKRTSYNKKLLRQTIQKQISTKKCVSGQLQQQSQKQINSQKKIQYLSSNDRDKRLQKELNIIRQMCMKSLTQNEQKRFNCSPLQSSRNNQQTKSSIRLNDFNKISINNLKSENTSNNPSFLNQNSSNNTILSSSIKQKFRSSQRNSLKQKYIQKNQNVERGKFKTQIQVENQFQDHSIYSKNNKQSKLSGQIEKMLRKITKKQIRQNSIQKQKQEQEQLKKLLLIQNKVKKQQSKRYQQDQIKQLKNSHNKIKSQLLSQTERNNKREVIIHQIIKQKLKNKTIQRKQSITKKPIPNLIFQKKSKQAKQLINTQKLPNLNLKIQSQSKKQKSYKTIQPQKVYQQQQQQQNTNLSLEKRERVRFSYKLNKRSKNLLEQSNDTVSDIIEKSSIMVGIRKSKQQYKNQLTKKYKIAYNEIYSKINFSNNSKEKQKRKNNKKSQKKYQILNQSLEKDYRIQEQQQEKSRIRNRHYRNRSCLPTIDQS